jgi:hypothetical protein
LATLARLVAPAGATASKGARSAREWRLACLACAHGSAAMPVPTPCRTPTPQLPWAPLFSEEEMQRGVTHYGGGERLLRVAAKLLAGRPIKAVALGGSVTFGHGVDDPALSYPSLFFRFINTSFPHRWAAACSRLYKQACCGRAPLPRLLPPPRPVPAPAELAQGPRAQQPGHAGVHQRRRRPLRREHDWGGEPLHALGLCCQPPRCAAGPSVGALQLTSLSSSRWARHRSGAGQASGGASHCTLMPSFPHLPFLPPQNKNVFRSPTPTYWCWSFR